MRQQLITIFLTLAVTAGVLIGSAKAGLLDSMMNSGLEEVEATANYEIKTYGWDSRVYEFTPAWNKNVSCAFIASNKSSGAACYEIDEEFKQ